MGLCSSLLGCLLQPVLPLFPGAGCICSWLISFSGWNCGAGKKIHAGPCHFSSGCHCFSKSLIKFSLVKTRNEKHTFNQMTSLRLESVIVYPHPSLASLGGEGEACAYPCKSSAFSAWYDSGRSLGELTLAGNACWLWRGGRGLLFGSWYGSGKGVRPSNSAEDNREAQNWNDLEIASCMMQCLSLCNSSVHLKYKIYLQSLSSLMSEERKLSMQGNTVHADWDLEDASEHVSMLKEMRPTRPRNVFLKQDYGKTWEHTTFFSWESFVLSGGIFLCKVVGEAPQPLPNNWDLFCW